jgi:hypothetical protein
MGGVPLMQYRRAIIAIVLLMAAASSRLLAWNTDCSVLPNGQVVCLTN